MDFNSKNSECKILGSAPIVIMPTTKVVGSEQLFIIYQRTFQKFKWLNKYEYHRLCKKFMVERRLAEEEEERRLQIEEIPMEWE